MLTLLVDLVVLRGFFFLVGSIRVRLLLNIARDVALHARRAAGIRRAAVVALGDVLLAADDACIIHHRGKGLTIRQAVVKIQLHADAGKCTPFPERLIEQGLHLFLDVVLHLARHLKLGDGLCAKPLFILIVGIIQDLARIVDDCDVLRGQALDAVCRKVDNTFDFLFRQLCMRLQAQHNGSRRRLLLFFVKAVLGQHDVNTRLIDGLDLLDGARQLALQCLQVVDAVLELGHTEFAVIEYLESLVPVRKSLHGKIEACLMHIRRRNENRRTRLILLYFVADLRFTQLIRDLARILGLHVGKQRNHIGLAAVPETKAEDQYENCECRAEHDVALPLVKAFPQGKAALFPLSHNLFPFKSPRLCFPARVQTERQFWLYLHPHDFLIGRNGAIAHLQGKLQGNFSLLPRHDNLRNIFYLARSEQLRLLL